MEPAGPYPPRFWWLKRLSLCLLLLLVALAALRLWWGREARRRLEAALAPVIAAGDPVDAAGMNLTPVPDEVNAALYLKRAAAAIDRNADSPAASSLEWPDHPPFGAEWNAMAHRSVVASGKAFPLARRARAYERGHWGTEVKSPAITTLMTHFGDVRHLANTLGDGALYAHLNGDDVAALETIRDVRHAGRVAGAEPWLIGNLVHIGVEALAMDRLEKIATGLRVAPEDGPPPPEPAADPEAAMRWPVPVGKRTDPPRAVTPSHVRVVIAELLDERDLVESLRRALAGERSIHLDMAAVLGRRAWVTRPMFELDALRMAEADAVVIEAAAQPTWPEAKSAIGWAAARLPRAPPTGGFLFGVPRGGGPRRPRTPLDFTRMLSSDLVGAASFDRAIDQNMRVRAERRLVAVSLAAQLYRAEHGQWPPALEALVPKYLPAVPRDPMAAGDVPVGYLLARGALPGGGDRPVVFHAGTDGKQDTTPATRLPPEPAFGWQRGRDEWRDISRWVPPGSPATMPTTAPATAPSTGSGVLCLDPPLRRHSEGSGSDPRNLGRQEYAGLRDVPPGPRSFAALRMTAPG